VFPGFVWISKRAAPKRFVRDSENDCRIKQKNGRQKNRDQLAWGLNFSAKHFSALSLSSLSPLRRKNCKTLS
jgi:hypothetical protein